MVAVAEADQQDLLDDYVEAQVHGGIELARDVETLVLDPGFAGTEVERLARGMPCPVSWHVGFALDLTEVAAHPDFRGPPAVELAGRLVADSVLAGDGCLTRSWWVALRRSTTRRRSSTSGTTSPVSATPPTARPTSSPAPRPDRRSCRLRPYEGDAYVTLIRTLGPRSAASVRG